MRRIRKIKKHDLGSLVKDDNDKTCEKYHERL